MSAAVASFPTSIRTSPALTTTDWGVTAATASLRAWSVIVVL